MQLVAFVYLKYPLRNIKK